MLKLSMVRPSMEYATVVWGPHNAGYIHELEKIQCKAARWVLDDYGDLILCWSVYRLGWDTL